MKPESTHGKQCPAWAGLGRLVPALQTAYGEAWNIEARRVIDLGHKEIYPPIVLPTMACLSTL